MPQAAREIVENGPVCPTKTDTVCSFSLTDFFFGIGYRLDPRPSQYSLPITFRVVARHEINLIREGFNRLNETSWDVNSQPPPVGKEIFYTSLRPPRAVLPDALPSELTYDRGGGYTSCTRGENGAASEPISIGYASLSTPAGELLFASAGMLVRNGGVLEIASEASWPFDLLWVDAGCAPCGPNGEQTVAVELTLRGETKPAFQALPGEQKPLVIDGVRYTFRLGSLGRHPDPAYCGVGGWTLWRSDLVVELNEDGTVKIVP